MKPSSVLLTLAALLQLHCSQNPPGSSTFGFGQCGVVANVELPFGSRIDATNTSYRITTPAANAACRAVWNACVAYADSKTTAVNHTEPNITYAFGINNGPSLYDTPDASTTPASGSDATVEWCHALTEEVDAGTTSSASFYLSARSNFTPPADGSLDVSIRAFIRYTPYVRVGD